MSFFNLEMLLKKIQKISEQILLVIVIVILIGVQL